MVVTGNFAQTPFYKAISGILKQSGILEIWNLPDKNRYTLYIKEGNLRCIKVNDRFANPLESKTILMDLLAAERGSFELKHTSFRTPCEPSLKWPLERVLISLTILDEEIQLRTVKLAPAQVAFQTVSGQSDPELERTFFWKQAKPFLEKGIAAKELAPLLKLSESMVCYYLAKLERAGMIAPSKDLDLDLDF